MSDESADDRFWRLLDAIVEIEADLEVAFQELEEESQRPGGTTNDADDWRKVEVSNG